MRKRNASGIFRRKMRGFTMLEVMVSVVIISAVALGVMGTVLYTKRASSIMQQRMIASQLIDRQLAEYKSQSDPLSDSVTYPLIEDGDILKSLKNAKMKVEVTQLGDPSLKKVIVTVAWNFPWYAGEGACSLNPTNANCDKEESVVTVIFKESV